MLATATIIGNIGKIEVRSAGQNKVANFSLCANEKRDGQEIAHWFSIAAWDRLADVIELYATKGTKLCVVGAIRTRKYEKEGQVHTAVEIRASSIELLGSPASTTEPRPNVPPARDTVRDAQQYDPAKARPEDDDSHELPF